MRTCPTCHRAFVDTQEACPLDAAPLGAATPGDLPADVGRILGQYRLIGRLAEGGMGHIFIGAHTRLNRYVAIKLLKPELQHRTDAIARFFDEARTVNTIKHPHIVESIDLVADHGHGAYCVLELLHGPSLKRRLEDGALPLASAVRVAAEIADALHVVHAQGIVHRDLKPENLILIERDGRDDFVKLIDFGVAQIGHDEADGRPFGTAAYMAPEQAAGQRVDGRADVYALGVIAFEMITGTHPFPSTTDHEYVLRHADETPPRPSKLVPVPRELDAIVVRCLAKRPEERFPSAAAVADALRRVTVDRVRARTGLALVLGGLAAAGVAAALIVPGLRAQPPRAATANEVPLEPAPPRGPAPAPATITFKFTSTPAGAKVFRKGETVPLGTTPFETALVKGERAPLVTFQLDGYAPREVDTALAGSATIVATLAKLPPPVALQQKRELARTPPKIIKPPQVHREGVMDPFATKN